MVLPIDKFYPTNSIDHWFIGSVNWIRKVKRFSREKRRKKLRNPMIFLQQMTKSNYRDLIYTVSLFVFFYSSPLEICLVLYNCFRYLAGSDRQKTWWTRQTALSLTAGTFSRSTRRCWCFWWWGVPSWVRFYSRSVFTGVCWTITREPFAASVSYPKALLIRSYMEYKTTSRNVLRSSERVIVVKMYQRIPSALSEINSFKYMYMYINWWHL